MNSWTPPVRTMRDVLVDGERRLAIVGVPTPRVDAELLLAHVLGVPRGRVFLSDPVDPTDAMRFEALLVRRAARVPLQHLVGEAPFRHLVLQVGRGVFVPRPETEAVAELAIRALSAGAEERLAVDLCTGSGALALSLATEVPHSRVHAVELEGLAFEWATRNITAYADELAQVGSEVVLHRGDASTAHLGPLAPLIGRVDVVVSNPPYIPDDAVPRDPEVRDYDPPRALYGGHDGLDVVARPGRGGCRAAAPRRRPRRGARRCPGRVRRVGGCAARRTRAGRLRRRARPRRSRRPRPRHHCGAPLTRSGSGWGRI